MLAFAFTGPLHRWMIDAFIGLHPSFSIITTYIQAKIVALVNELTILIESPELSEVVFVTLNFDNSIVSTLLVRSIV